MTTAVNLMRVYLGSKPHLTLLKTGSKVDTKLIVFICLFVGLGSFVVFLNPTLED